jgi:lipid A disaccharide synthetase
MKKLFIVTGEYSGSMHATKVVECLKSQYPNIQIEGIGDSNLENAGVKLFENHSKMSPRLYASPKAALPRRGQDRFRLVM